MAVWVDGASGEHITGPTVGPADFDELVREDPGVTAGEGIGLGDGRRAGFDGPSLELRGEVRAVEERDRETRRRLTPGRGIEAHGDIFPRAHRRTPFPESELTLARPPGATSEPSRTEVMEEREEH